VGAEQQGVVLVVVERVIRKPLSNGVYREGVGRAVLG
jgi:hypothetical protein